MAQRPRLKVQDKPAITITRSAYAATEVVYIAYANRPLRYSHDDSRIAYIGSTKKGAWRIAGSAAWKAEDLVQRHGVHTLEYYVIVAPRYGTRPTYRSLERALLLRFRERYGSPPIANQQGRRMRWREDDRIYTAASIDRVLDDFAR